MLGAKGHSYDIGRSAHPGSIPEIWDRPNPPLVVVSSRPIKEDGVRVRRWMRVVQLWAWEELSYEEIAVALGVAVGTVRSRLHRARTRLDPSYGTVRLDRASTDDTPSGAASDRERLKGEDGHET